MRSYSLDEFDLPNIVVYENGDVYDSLKEKYIGKSTDRCVICSCYGMMVVRSFTRKWLIGYCFNAPWQNGIKCVNLSVIGCHRYYATEDGRVFGTRNMAYVKPSITHDGYLTLSMYMDNGDYMPWRLHRVIAMAFIPNPDNKDTVDHIDGNKLNNRVDNLRWMWMWENIDHRREMYNGYTNEQIRSVCRCLEKGMTQTQAAKKAGVPRSLVKAIQYGSYYRITRYFNIPRYRKQPRMPVEFVQGEVIAHGQQNRKHELSLNLPGSTTSQTDVESSDSK